MTQTVCDCCRSVTDQPMRFSIKGKGAPSQLMATLTQTYDVQRDEMGFDICIVCVDVFLKLVRGEAVSRPRSQRRDGSVVA